MGTSVLATLVILAIGLAAGQARADYSSYQWRKAEESRHTVTFIPPTPIWPEVVGEVQLTIAPSWSVYADAAAVSKQMEHGVLSAVTIDLGVRYFVLGTAPEGLWVGPWVGAGVADVDFKGADHEAKLALRGGAMAGATWLPFGRLVLMACGGVAYEGVGAERGDRLVGRRGLVPVARVGIGFRF
jgi:hypothetical protein